MGADVFLSIEQFYNNQWTCNSEPILLYDESIESIPGICRITYNEFIALKPSSTTIKHSYTSDYDFGIYYIPMAKHLRGFIFMIT